jgi:hypothetical protein
MDEVQVAAAISAGVLAIGLIVLVRLFRGYFIDSFRDQLFALRDEVFLYACDEGLLESPAYTNLRLLMNGMIRYGHRVSAGRLIALDFARRIFRISLKPPPTYTEWTMAVAALPADQAQHLRHFHAEAMLLAVKHMMSVSPPLWLATLLLGSYFLIWRSTRMVLDATANALRRRMPEGLLESEAFKAAPHP